MATTNSYKEFFFASKIGASVYEGVNYGLFKKKVETDKNFIEECKKANDEELKIIEVSNGYIVVSTLKDAAKYTTEYANSQIDKTSNKLNKQEVYSCAKESKQNHIELFIKECVKNAQKGAMSFDIALYGRNVTNETEQTLKNAKTNQIATLSYKTFNITLDEVKRYQNLLYRNGFRISQVIAGEILPNGRGVRYRIILENC